MLLITSQAGSARWLEQDVLVTHARLAGWQWPKHGIGLRRIWLWATQNFAI